MFKKIFEKLFAIIPVLFIIEIIYYTYNMMMKTNEVIYFIAFPCSIILALKYFTLIKESLDKK